MPSRKGQPFILSSNMQREEGEVLSFYMEKRYLCSRKVTGQNGRRTPRTGCCHVLTAFIKYRVFHSIFFILD